MIRHECPPELAGGARSQVEYARIPHYKEIILMSFHCQECGFSNNEIQSGGQKGKKFTVEGILAWTVAAMGQDQPVRRHTDPEGAEQIVKFVTKIQVEDTGL